MKSLYLIFFFLIQVHSCVVASDKSINKMIMYYAKNPRVVEVIDSINRINGKDKKTYNYETFLVYLKKNNSGITIIFDQCIYNETTAIDYTPIGCMIYNDSYFFLVNKDLDIPTINIFFQKTDIKICPHISRVKYKPVDMKNKKRVFTVFRPATVLQFKNYQNEKQ